jgi:nucleoside-diphosphate-sugar epimerase
MKILMTGVTGFIGSALALHFLFANKEVIALYREDTEGLRTKKAIQFACEGFSFDQSEIPWDNLTVVNFDFNNPETLTDILDLSSIDLVWHIAAELSYSKRDFKNSFNFNHHLTGKLYQIFSDNCSQCRRFYYMSTSYTGDYHSKMVYEQLHIYPEHDNVYQASKWAAEMALSRLVEFNSLPVTIFRPSIVVGHDKTGWHGNSEIGLYRVAYGFYYLQKQGINSISIDVDPESPQNIIPVNYVVDYAMKLSKRNDSHKNFEIFHAAGKNSVRMGDGIAVSAELLNMEINIGLPENEIDKMFNKEMKTYHFFLKNHWQFSVMKLENELGDDFKPFYICHDVLKMFIEKYYFKKNEIEKNEISNEVTHYD